MDEMENLQSKCVNVTIPQLEERINKFGKQISQVRQEENQLLQENEAKLEELISEVIAMKENLHTERQTLEQKNKELLKYNDSLEKLKAEYRKFKEENQNLEMKKHCLKTTKPNQQDELLLEQGKAKLHLYKMLTGIRWDYSALKEAIQGYVTNKCDSIHHFCFTKNEQYPEQLSDLLWKEIYLCIENTLNEHKEEDLL